MKMNCRKRLLSLILCVMLTVAMAFTATGCNGGKNDESASDKTEAEAFADGDVLGEGSKEFAFTVADKEGNETHLTIRTDQEIVGDALQELGVIDGEEGEYGLYVKTVNGITADYDKDGVYWAFYVNGEYAAEGVDSTKITEGDTYAFKVE